MSTVAPFLRCRPSAFGKPVARLGLASHLKTSITADDVLHAIDRGIGFLNWLGVAEESEGGEVAFPTAIALLGARREDIVVCVQFAARTADDARDELATLFAALHTDYIDVLTLYYVEHREEWDQIRGPGGVLEFCRAAKRDGVVRRIGLSSHQRPLAAEMAESGELDLLMIRYNAAHRGAERDVFPTTTRLSMPVIAYTATRWGALMKPTADDPPEFDPPPAADWYRFALQHPAVSVTMCAPHTREEMEHDLSVLTAAGPFDHESFTRLAEHGARVRKYSGQFA